MVPLMIYWCTENIQARCLTELLDALRVYASYTACALIRCLTELLDALRVHASYSACALIRCLTELLDAPRVYASYTACALIKVEHICWATFILRLTSASPLTKTFCFSIMGITDPSRPQRYQTQQHSKVLLPRMGTYQLLIITLIHG